MQHVNLKSTIIMIKVASLSCLTCIKFIINLAPKGHFSISLKYYDKKI